MDALRENQYILNLEDGVTFYLPYCKYFDTIQMTIARDDNFYELDNLSYLKEKYLRPGMYILDIGANIGNHTIYFAKKCGAAHVFCFEPQKDVFDILSRNIELNQLDNVCTPYNHALGSNAGNAKIAAYNRANCGGTSLTMDEDGDIGVRTLDEMKLPSIDFIKIDVEGFELEVLKGGEKLLREGSPTLYMEIQDDNFYEVNRLLNSFGYAFEETIYGDYLYQKL